MTQKRKQGNSITDGELIDDRSPGNNRLAEHREPDMNPGVWIELAIYTFPEETGNSARLQADQDLSQPREFVARMVAIGGKFEAGSIVISCGVDREVSIVEQTRFLSRHLMGDWGRLDEFEWKQNDSALEYGGPLTSSYHVASGKIVCVFTEADRSCTTLFFPLEY